MALSITGIIPARYASTRLPKKPLIDLCGKPMIQHVYERVSKARLLTDVIVATDHEEIVKTVNGFGGKVVMTPSTLQSGSDRIAYVAKTLPSSEIIVNIQGDEPLIVPEMIDQAARLFSGDPAIQVGTLVKKMTSVHDLSNPSVVKVTIDANGYAIYFSRSAIPFVRDIPMEEWVSKHIFYKHLGLYAYRCDALLQYTAWGESLLERSEKLEQLRFIEHGTKIKIAETTFDSIPVDTIEDVERVRQMISKLNTK